MIDETQLKELIKQAFDSVSDTDIEPSQAREHIAEQIAQAIKLFVVGRETIVTGTSASGGPVSGTGVIQ